MSKVLATTNQQRRISTMRRVLAAIDADPHKAKRLEILLCPVCYYKGTASSRDVKQVMCAGEGCNGSVFTSTFGGRLYCQDCGKNNHMCIQCGADLELKT